MTDTLSLPQALLDRLTPGYRAFITSQPASYHVAFHTLTWSPAFRQASGFPVDMGQTPAVSVGSTRKIELCNGRFSVLVLTPEGEKPNEGWPVLLHMHGGGWVFGNVEGGISFFSRACVEAKCVVVSVGYRLAPEHPYPAAVDDAWDALLWVIGEGKDELGINPSKVAVGGVSAGGNLAAILAQRASVAGIPLVLQILTIPATDSSYSPTDPSGWTPSMREHEHIFALSVPDIFWFLDLYVPNLEDRTRPEVSPLLQDDPKAYERMAPALVSVMELDVLCSEGEKYAEKMRKFGVEVLLKKYKGLTHLNASSDRVCEVSRMSRDDRILALKIAFTKH
ncbi:carbohydrate esterase family 10 protein [Ceratobasidium sp. AG-Ba]|nr:carbohydrate esterase family 10 protein [Ceratobasidium sp. AG-Ba]